MSAAVQLGGVSNRGLRHLGVLRAVANLPAIVGSVGILLVFLTFLGRWEPAAILSWFAIGLAVLTRRGERLAVMAAYGFHRPSAEQLALLQRPWREAIDLARLAPDHVDLFISREAARNAYAVGSKSIAVTTGLLDEFLARRLRREHVCAVLLHEVGHLRSGATRFDVASRWLGAPWRMAASLLTRICHMVLGCSGFTVISAVGGGLVVAVVQAFRAGAWPVAATQTALGMFGMLCPLVCAVVARRSELDADEFAAEMGFGPALVDVLRDSCASHELSAGITDRLLRRHPPVARRIDAIATSIGRAQAHTDLVGPHFVGRRG